MTTYTIELTDDEINLIKTLVEADLECQVDYAEDPIEDDNDPIVRDHNNILDKLYESTAK
jgi:hypothetical protein